MGRGGAWWRRWSRVVRLVALVVVIVVAVGAGVSVVRSSSAPTVGTLRKRAGWADLRTLTVGVSGDVPGLSECTPQCKGFDVEIAYLIADWLGVRRADVTFARVIPEHRERMIGVNFLTNQIVHLDLVAAAFSITDKREKEDHVVFAGPYLTTETTVLTRRDHPRVDALTGLDQGYRETDGGAEHAIQKICTPGTSTSNDYLHQALRHSQIVARQRNSECVTELREGGVDAVVTDAAILAGFQARAPKELRLNNIASEQDERYGIGLGQDYSGSDGQLQARRQLVLLALQDLLDQPGPDNSWYRAFTTNFPPTQAGGGDDVQVVANDRQPTPLGLQKVRRWPWERNGSGTG